MKYLSNEMNLRTDVNSVKVSIASMTFATNFDQRNIGIVPRHPTFLSYRTILKQHSLFVPFEDQRIKKLRMNGGCQSLELLYFNNNPDFREEHNVVP